MLMPDTDAALVGFLAAHPVLSPLHGGRVGTSLSGSAPALRVAGLGGRRDGARPWDSSVEYQVEAWGGSQADAALLARSVCAAVYEMTGPVTGGHVWSAYPTLEPLWSPDESTGRPRYIVQVVLNITPEAS